MKFQSAFLQSRGNRIPNLLGLHLVPTMHDGIIGIPFERRLRIMLRHPSIKGIVQEKISQQGANHAPYTKGNFCHLKSPILRFEMGPREWECCDESQSYLRRPECL